MELFNQLNLVEEGLNLHKQRCGIDMSDLQHLLEEMLSKMKEKSKYLKD